MQVGAREGPLFPVYDGKCEERRIDAGAFVLITGASRDGKEDHRLYQAASASW